MRFVKLILAITIFFTALSVFLMSPERQMEVLETVGIGLRQPALFALSILGMVFSAVLGLRTVFEGPVMRSS